MVYGRYSELMAGRTDVFAWERIFGEERLIVVNNFTAEETRVDIRDIAGSDEFSLFLANYPDFAPDVYYLTSGGEWLTALPGKSTGLIITHDKNSRQQLCDRETECTLHALYSYPLAAATFVAVDVPAALVSTAWGVLTIPYYLAKAALD